MNYPPASLNEGVCEKDECTLIGIRERNSDGSTDCALITFVNIETRQVDDVVYFGSSAILGRADRKPSRQPDDKAGLRAK